MLPTDQYTTVPASTEYKTTWHVQFCLPVGFKHSFRTLHRASYSTHVGGWTKWNSNNKFFLLELVILLENTAVSSKKINPSYTSIRLTCSALKLRAYAMTLVTAPFLICGSAFWTDLQRRTRRSIV